MPRILTRLRKLEAQPTDRSGLMPHTKPWLDYWSPRIDNLIAGEPLDQKIPFEVIDTLIDGAEIDGHGDQAGRYDEADQQTS